MTTEDFAEDLSFLLYLVPLAASIIYGAYEWYSISRSSADLPGLAYLIVSKSPYLFLVSVAAILAALVIEVRGTALMERIRVVESNSTRMQVLAVAVLILSFAAALSVANYDVGNAFAVFIAGRYALIFSFGMVVLSLLLAPKQIVGSARASSLAEVIGLLLVVAAPVILYASIKIHLPFAIAAIASIVVAILGLYLFFNNTRIFGKKQEKRSVQTTPPLAA